MKMKQFSILSLWYSLFILILQAFFFQPVHAKEASKDRLVLMPLKVSEEDSEIKGPMENSLVQGLQQKYQVFSGDVVAKKAREIFMKESRNAAKKECDETRCMQGIAEAFQAELLATAVVKNIDGGYILSLSIQNIYDRKVVYSNSLPCRDCDQFQVLEKMKELSGAPVETEMARNAAPSRSSGGGVETELWNVVSEVNTISEYQNYLADYPRGKYASLANFRIKKLQEAAAEEEQRIELKAWQQAEKSGREEAYRDFLQRFPQGSRATLANLRIKKIQAEESALIEREAWEQAEQSGSEEDYQEYLQDYPQGSYVKLAQLRINKLRGAAAIQLHQQAWSSAEESGTVEGYQTYLRDYPQGSYVAQAQSRIKSLQEAEAKRLHQKAWDTAKLSGTVEGYQTYLRAYPRGSNATQAQNLIISLREAEANRLHQEAWDDAVHAGTEAGYQAYLKKYPGGEHADVAQDRISEIRAKLAIMKEDSFWDDVKNSNRVNTVQQYLRQYPDGRYAAAARQRISTIHEDESKRKAVADLPSF